MDNRATKLLEAAEAVVRARQALTDAEGAFESLTGFQLGPGLRRAGAAASVARPYRTRRRRNGATPVSAQVRAVLAQGPLEFGEIVAAVGGRDVAARSALKKDRERGVVQFKGGKYRLKATAPVAGSSVAKPA